MKNSIKKYKYIKMNIKTNYMKYKKNTMKMFTMQKLNQKTKKKLLNNQKI